MGTPDRQVTVLASPWDRHWDLYILDAVTGLIGATTVPELDGAEAAARRYLTDQGQPVGDDVSVQVVLAPRGLAR